VAALVAAAPAAAVAGSSKPGGGGPSGGGSTTTSSAPTCNAPVLSEVYSWAQDINWYAGIPGEKWDAMRASGWTLRGGAKIMADTLADGTRGNVLYMPSGATAVTPEFCISNSYPLGRTEIRNLAGTQGVSVLVSYLGAKGWGKNVASGSQTGTSTFWSLPSPFTVPASTVTGWQYARFTFAAMGSKSTYELSNLYIDPRMH
jgi:hypothetical protein